ncbi:phosphonate degradation associated HDIG domain protein [Chitinivorax tropicus]|uniref:Phosphonate degradation associated HDIG domain protein n=1 Tax=Chitinivorax tropicus TaxID=714531 RepID=A0A840MH95_9PROT|nr:phosphonate degradation HD-domain oxygenase [Chitinivorax tropicus]MBB5018594.1 phosphonate degradation associated HDIG domain protein [Chitinivorax tropicus]
MSDASSMTTTPSFVFTDLDAIRTCLITQGSTAYGGEAISQLEHALQAAHAAEQADASPEVIIAALLHDIGHLVAGQQDDDLANGIDDHHEAIGANALKALFGPAVWQPIALHVAAKRYLCATEPGYLAGLSLASQQSLALQGGPMDDEAASRFRQRPHAEAAILVRRFDDEAKVPNLPTPTLKHFLALAKPLCAADSMS